MSTQRAPRRQNNTSSTIRVSEIGEYAYCSRAWWYRHVVKIPVPHNGKYRRLAEGTQAHYRHGYWVAVSARLRSLAIGLVLCGLLALGVALWIVLKG